MENLVRVLDGEVYQPLPQTGNKRYEDEANSQFSDITMSPSGSQMDLPRDEEREPLLASSPRRPATEALKTVQLEANVQQEQEQSVVNTALDKLASQLQPNATQAVNATITLPNGALANVTITPVQVLVDVESVASNSSRVSRGSILLQNGQNLPVDINLVLPPNQPQQQTQGLFQRMSNYIGSWLQNHLAGNRDDDDEVIGGRRKSRRRRSRSTKKRPIRRRMATKRRGTRKRQRRYTKRRRGLRRR